MQLAAAEDDEDDDGSSGEEGGEARAPSDFVQIIRYFL